MKKTAVIGATTNPSRYAYIAAGMLVEKGHQIVPIGLKKGVLEGEEILNIKSRPEVHNLHTVTMYIGSRHQPEWYDYILSLNPKRIIFNPGTENPEFEKMANDKGIETENACTLVLLRVGSY